MASILKSIADKAQAKIDKTMSAPWRAVPKPDMSKAVYGIGMGIGPFIERLVKKMNDDAKRRDRTDQKNDQAAKKRHQETIGQMKFSDKQVLKQMSTMNQLLSKILLVQQTNLKNAGRKIPVRSVGGATAISYGNQPEVGQVTAKKAGSIDESGMGFLKFAFGTVGLAALWKLMPQEIKDALGNLGRKLKEDIVNPMVEGIKDWFITSLKENPIATILGTLFVAKITKVLDLAIDIVKGAVYLGKGAANVAEKIYPGAGTKAPTTTPGGTVAPGASGSTQPPPAGTVPPAEQARAGGFWNSIRRMFGKEEIVSPVKGAPEGTAAMKVSDAAKEYKELAKYTSPEYADDVMKKMYGDKALEAIKQSAGVTQHATTGATKTAEAASKTAEKTAEAAAEAGQAAGKLAKSMAFLKNLLGPLGVGLSGYSAYGNFEEGKNISGVLDTISAITGAGAIVTGVTGVGLPVAGILGAVSLLTGLAGTVSSMIEEGKPKAAPTPPAPTPPAPNPNVQGAKPSATGPSPSSANYPTAATIPGIDNNRLLELFGKLESSGNYKSDTNIGFVGKYGMGAMALEDIGLLKPGTSRGRTRGPGSAIYDPTAWTQGYSLQQFLDDPSLQDKAAKAMLAKNYKQLERMGIVDDKMSPEELAGRLYVAWHGGPGGARALFKEGVARPDFKWPNVTTATSYEKAKAGYGTTQVATASNATTVPPAPIVGGGNGQRAANDPRRLDAGMEPTAPTGLAAIDLSSPQAALGQIFAQYQDAFVKAVEITTKQPVKIDMTNIMNDAQQRAQETRGAPSRTEPMKENVALQRANFVVGTA